MLELLKLTEVIVGLVITGFGLLLSGFLWWDKRLSARATSKANALRGQIEQVDKHMINRLDKVEERMSSLEKESEATQRRVNRIETSIGKLATSEQVSEIKADVARLGEASRQMSGTLDTLYQAAIRAAEARK
ncbi:hypothetical protein [Pseudaestuariivita sp.]|uniref:hypothetical protein n=1 Tax=Pseudaestuariivita sp. TaxID=2211669 RepID=UPI00405A1D7E